MEKTDEVKQIYVYKKVAGLIREFQDKNMSKLIKNCTEAYFSKRFNELIEKVESDKNLQKEVKSQKLKELKNELLGVINFEGYGEGEHDNQLMSSMIRSVDNCLSELLQFEDVADIFYDYAYCIENGVYPKKKKVITVYGKTNSKN